MPLSRIIDSRALVIFVPWNATLMSCPTLRSSERTATGSPGGPLGEPFGAQAAMALAAAAPSRVRLLMEDEREAVPPPDARRRAPGRAQRDEPARRRTREVAGTGGG